MKDVVFENLFSECDNVEAEDAEKNGAKARRVRHK